MKLSDLQPVEGSRKKRKRVGRGTGSGHGTTAGYGNKGQRARSGGNKAKGFEGGQMPLTRRIPKKGFKNPFRREYALVTVGDLEMFKKLKDGVKLLSGGEIGFPLKVTVHKASAKAIDKIKAQGGEVEVLI